MRLGLVAVDSSCEVFPKLNLSMFLSKRPTLAVGCCPLTANKVEDDETFRKERGVEVVYLEALRTCAEGSCSCDVCAVLLVTESLVSDEIVMYNKV